MKKILYLTISILAVCSCNQNSKNNEQLQKENKLLKKENELLTKEKQLDSIKSTFASSQSKSTSPTFTTFTSDFGYKIDYPAFLHKLPSRQFNYEEFSNNNGDILLSLHSFNLSDFTLNGYYGDEFQVKGRTMDYNVFKNSWYVVSGTKDDGKRAYYTKSYLSNNSPKEVRVMYLEYPKSRKDEFDNIIPRMIKTFKDK